MRTVPLNATKRGVAFLVTITLLLPVYSAAQQTLNMESILRGGGLQGGAALGGAGRTPDPSRLLEKPKSLENMDPQKRHPVSCRFVPLDERGNPLRPPYIIEGASRVKPSSASPEEAIRNANRDLGIAGGNEAARGVEVFDEIFYYPNAFELYVKEVTGKELCRFGHQASADLSAFFEPPPLAMVPEDYVLGSGDEVYIRLWGSVEQDIALTIDRSGQIVIPKVGPVKLAGVRYAQAADVVRQATRKLFSDFNVSVSLGQLRGIRVYVTGYVERPGAYNVSNFSSLAALVMAAGGPSSAGSFRHIELRRGGKVLSEFDLYELLLEGNKSKDRVLVSEDVIHIGPIGQQVAVFGGVNKPAVFEIKPNESVEKLLRMAGGFVPGADASLVYRLSINERQAGFQPISMLKDPSVVAKNGDILLAQGSVSLQFPSDKALKRVVISGQVRSPGQYFLPPGATLSDAIASAGGFVPGAYLYGLRMSRESVRQKQEESLKRVLRELDRDIVASSTIQPTNAEEARLLQVRADLSRTLVSRLSSFRPDGRISLPVAPNSPAVPLMELMDGDLIEVPSIPQDVGVYGSVVSPGNFLFRSNGVLQDYIKLAGGAKKGADPGETFVIRANGQAEKLRASGVWGLGFLAHDSAPVYPGDVVVVPEDMAKTTLFRELSSWATLLYQLGLGVAAFKVLQD